MLKNSSDQIFKSKYLNYKKKYLNLKNKKGGGGKPPYNFLVIGGGRPELYGEGFFEVGDHPTANYGAYMDWKDPEFWPGLVTMLSNHGYRFDGIIIDNGSFSWIQPEVIEQILNLFEIVLKADGVILLEAYDARDKIKEYDITPATLYYEFNKLLVGSDAFIPVYDFRFPEGEGSVFRIYTRPNAKLTMNKEGLYDYGEELLRLRPDHYFDVFSETVKEKNQVEFLKNRLLQKPVLRGAEDTLWSQVPRTDDKLGLIGTQRLGMHNIPKGAEEPQRYIPKGIEEPPRPPRPQRYIPKGVEEPPRPDVELDLHNLSGSGYAVCCNYGRVDEKEFIDQPRIIVSLLNLVFDKPKLQRIKLLPRPRNLGDLLELLDIHGDYPELIGSPYRLVDIGLNIINEACNLSIGKYVGGDGFSTNDVLLQYRITGEPPKELRDRIIAAIKYRLDQKRQGIYSADDFSMEVLPDKINLENIIWEFTILVSSIDISHEDEKYVNMFFNSWLIKERKGDVRRRVGTPIINGDQRYPLVGIFDAKGCIRNKGHDRNEQYALHNAVAPVDQHLHFVDGGFNFGSDMARLDVSSCFHLVQTAKVDIVHVTLPLEDEISKFLGDKHYKKEVERQVREVIKKYPIKIDESTIDLDLGGNTIKLLILEDYPKSQPIIFLNGDEMDDEFINKNGKLLSIIDNLAKFFL